MLSGTNVEEKSPPGCCCLNVQTKKKIGMLHTSMRLQSFVNILFANAGAREEHQFT